MSFFGKLKDRLRVFGIGRYGMDNLSGAVLWVGLALLLLDAFLQTGILQLLSIALYAFVIFRALSKNREARTAENRKYIARINAYKTKFKQAKVRFSNRKEYKYVRCPHCRALIRLPRGAGSLSVHCKPCGHTFERKT